MSSPVVTALPRTSPEFVGVPSDAVNGFLDQIADRKLELHSLMLLRRGQVFAEGWWHPFSADRRHLLYSLSKSFTSTAIGMLVDEGRLSIEDPVVSFFPDEIPVDASGNLRAMRVRDLLTMTAGHDADDMNDLFGRKDGNWARGFLSRPVPFEPGTHFVYNTAATYMCSAILTRVTGQSLFAYLTPRMFDPLGITGAAWTTCPKGVTYGGSGLSVRTEDIARFGQFCLQKGEWNGRRLVSGSWIEQATGYQVPNGPDPNNDWNCGYGFQFWRCRHECYRGDGAFGQFCIVVPETEMVIAMTSSVDDMGAVTQAVWDNLRYLPGEPLAENREGANSLAERLRRLEVAGPQGAPSSPTAKRIENQWYRATKTTGYQAIRFTFDEHGASIALESEDGSHHLRVGRDRWHLHRGPQYGVELAVRGAWKTPDVYTVAMRCMDGPETRTFDCIFTANRLSCTELKRGYFGPPEGRHFEGVLQL